VAWHPTTTGEVTVNITDITTASSHQVPLRTLEGTHRARLQDHAFDAWQQAERELLARWDAYLAADRPSRRRAAFADYVAALDAEADAAHVLAKTTLDLAAAA
jgi:hypothetical protein